MKLFQYYEDYGRMGSLQGLFFLTEDEVKNFWNKSFYWDELLGKHSEGEFTVDDSTMTEVDLPKDVLDLIYGKLGKVISGDCDPDYWAEQLEES